jgi:hypothetical protein
VNDNVLIRSNEEPAATSASSAYPLDWSTTEVKLGKGRFRHVLRRPTAEQIFKRDEDLQQEVPIRPDGSYSLPDPTANDTVDAKFYDEICESNSGFETTELSAFQKSAAVHALWKREIYIGDDQDPFADEVVVLDEIGSGDDPDFVISHVLRQPKTSELDSYRRKSAANSHVKPGKRGRQILVTRSNLKSLAAFYDLWIVRIDGATVEGQTWSENDRTGFLAMVDPIVKRKVVAELFDAVTTAARD